MGSCAPPILDPRHTTLSGHSALLRTMSNASLVQSWLRQNISTYQHQDRLFADVDATLSRFPTLRPKTDVYSASRSAISSGQATLTCCTLIQHMTTGARNCYSVSTVSSPLLSAMRPTTFPSQSGSQRTILAGLLYHMLSPPQICS